MMRGFHCLLLFVLIAAAACSEGAVQITDRVESSPASTLTPDQRARVATLADAWPLEPSYAASFQALDPQATSIKDGAVVSLFDPNDPHSGLPDDANRVFIESYCAACHSLQLVMQQHMYAAAWDAVLTRMVAARGMPEMRPDVRQSVLTYLTTHFGPGGQP
jgi:hypothetical protein